MSKDCSQHVEAIGKGILVDILLNGAKGRQWNREVSGKTTRPGWIFLRFSPAISVLLYSQTIVLQFWKR